MYSSRPTLVISWGVRDLGSWRGKVLSYILNKVERGEKIHLLLIDPDKVRDMAAVVRNVEEAVSVGCDAILIGGSLAVTPYDIDVLIDALTDVDVPKILFPGSVAGISRKADAILFMSLLNSQDPYYIVGAQMSAAPIIKKLELEVIPTAYIIVGYGGAAGYVGCARPIPMDRPEIAAAYALAAKYMGMKLIYLEAGSGAPKHIPGDFVKVVKKAIGKDVVLIVGGGIRSEEAAKEIVRAGADGVVTGTVFEEDPSLCKRIIKAVKEIT